MIHEERQASSSTTVGVEQAYQLILRGGLVLFPTDVGYALLGHSDSSMQLMYRIKERPLTKPIVVIGNREVLANVAVVTSRERGLIEAVTENFPCAFVVRANRDSVMLRNLAVWVRTQLVTDDRIAVFLNTGRLTEELVARAARDRVLIVGSSANPSGSGNRYRLQDVEGSIAGSVQGIVDGGNCRYTHPLKRGTTIVDFENLAIERVGIKYDEISKLLVEHGFNFRERRA